MRQGRWEFLAQILRDMARNLGFGRGNLGLGPKDAWIWCWRRQMQSLAACRFYVVFNSIFFARGTSVLPLEVTIITTERESLVLFDLIESKGIKNNDLKLAGGENVKNR